MNRMSTTVLLLLVAGVAVAAEQKLKPGALDWNDRFGNAVAINGDSVIVGAPYDGDLGSSAGAAYIYERASGVWSLETKITAGDGETGACFGSSVALMGDWALVGAPCDAVDDEGAVYVFKRLSGGWVQQTKLRAKPLSSGCYNFGSAVSLWEGVALIGAKGDWFGGRDTGSAFIIERIGDTWTQVVKLTASDAEPYAEFGSSVALFGLGTFAIIGAPNQDGMGAAYLFENDGGSWLQTDKLIPADRAANDHYGTSVAGNIFGGYAYVGSPDDDPLASNSGSVYVFAYSGGNWALHAKLVPEAGGSDDSFGYSVASSLTSLAVGTPGWQAGIGAVHSFSLSGATWYALGVRPSNLLLQGRLGTAVAVTGTDAVVGAPDTNTQAGVTYCYTWDDLKGIFVDSFETGTTSRWSSVAGK